MTYNMVCDFCGRRDRCLVGQLPRAWHAHGPHDPGDHTLYFCTSTCSVAHGEVEQQQRRLRSLYPAGCDE